MKRNCKWGKRRQRNVICFFSGLLWIFHVVNLHTHVYKCTLLTRVFLILKSWSVTFTPSLNSSFHSKTTEKKFGPDDVYMCRKRFKNCLNSHFSNYSGFDENWRFPDFWVANHEFEVRFLKYFGVQFFPEQKLIIRRLVVFARIQSKKHPTVYSTPTYLKALMNFKYIQSEMQYETESLDAI